MIFSGVVACATDVCHTHILFALRVTSLFILAFCTRFGGPLGWDHRTRRSMAHRSHARCHTSLCPPARERQGTLPFISSIVDPHPPMQYNTAVHYASQTHMCIVTPHWFDDAVRLGRRIPETPYTWPDPQVLRPGMSLNADDDALATQDKRKRKAPAETETGDGTDIPNQGEHVRVWDGRRILLSTTLELAESSRGAIEAGIQRAGGIVVPITEGADENAEENAVGKCDVLITRWRGGKSYLKVAAFDNHLSPSPFSSLGSTCVTSHRYAQLVV